MTGKPLIITTSLITLLAAAMQVEARDGNTGEGLIPAENYFDGAPLNNKRARRIAQRAGDRFLAVKQCTDGRDRKIRGCIDLSVKKDNGRRFDYRITDQVCTPDNPVDQRPGSGTNSNTEKQGGGIKPIREKAHCYDKYTLLFRARRNVTTEVRKNGASLYSTSSLQVPALAGKERWVTVGNMERSVTFRNLTGIPTRMNWRLEVSDASGTALDSDNGSENISLSGSKADMVRSEKQIRMIPPGKKDKCRNGADKIVSGLDAIAHKAASLCTASSFGLENFEIGYFSSRRGDKRYTGRSLASVCHMLATGYQQEGSLSDEYFRYCIYEKPSPNPPDEPPEPPPVREPMKPICPPKSSNVPEKSTQYEGGRLCEVITQEECSIDEEMNTCSCESVQIEESVCEEGGNPLVMEPN